MNASASSFPFIPIGVASGLVAKLLNRFRWIRWIGLAIIVYVALDMIWGGGIELFALYGEAQPGLDFQT
jgi:predicted tellurium resistance membrane protein TerC